MAMTDLGNLTGSGGDLFDPANAYAVSNLYKQVYTDLVRLQIQQFDSELSDTLLQETIEGEVKSFDKYLKHNQDQLVTRGRFGEWGGAATGDKGYGATDSERRLIEPEWFEYAELFDPRDEVGLLRAIAPDGQYLANIAAIFNQRRDRIILDALKGEVLVQERTGNGITTNTTTGYTNEFKITGSEAPYLYALPAATEGNEIGCDVNVTGAGITANTVMDVAVTAGAAGVAKFIVNGHEFITTGGGVAQDDPRTSGTPGAPDGGALILDTGVVATEITPFSVNKMLLARAKLDANNALMPGMPYLCVLHPNSFYQLMESATDNRFTSIDFNEGKPLVGGQAFVYMGFEFRLSTQVDMSYDIAYDSGGADDFDTKVEGVPVYQGGDTATAKPVRWVYFYSPPCGIIGMNQNMDVRFDEIPERGYSLQMWHSIGMNSIRMDGDCIVRCAVVDTF